MGRDGCTARIRVGPRAARVFWPPSRSARVAADPGGGLGGALPARQGRTTRRQAVTAGARRHRLARTWILGTVRAAGVRGDRVGDYGDRAVADGPVRDCVVVSS